MLLHDFSSARSRIAPKFRQPKFSLRRQLIPMMAAAASKPKAGSPAKNPMQAARQFV
jgi:hypothetical protein